LKLWNKIFIIFIIYAHTYALPKEVRENNLGKEGNYWKKEAERLRFENEDALIELQVKELQREIEQEKVEILTSERPTPDKTHLEQAKKKKNRMYQNILLPGLGSLNNGENLKGFLTISIFSILAFSTYTNFQHTNSVRKQIDSLYYLEYLEQIRLTKEYETSYNRTNLFLIGTIAFYLFNLFESNSWEENSFKGRLQNHPVVSVNTFSTNSSVLEKNFSIYWQFRF
jgi:hypothetical protein